MGTNFYWITSKPELDDDGDLAVYRESHIGKRSAAGRYCYDCKVSLCVGGENNVHEGYEQYNSCPRCGKGEEPKAYNAVMVELGFEQATAQKLTGVQGTSSFTWAQTPEQVIARCNERLFQHCVEDEYGRTYTGQQFLWMLDTGCPIRFYHSIGVEFS